MRDFFWLHIRKAGGTSLKKILRPYYPHSEWKYGTPFVALEKSRWNDNVNNYLVSLGEYEYKRMLFAKRFLYSGDEFDAMYKFAVVRNPYHRAVSSWIYLTKNWSIGKPKLMYAKRSFSYFLQMLPELWESRWDRHVSTHTAPMWQDMSDEQGLLLLDDVFRLESLHEDIRVICEKLDIPGQSISKSNSSGVADYQRFLTKKTISLIEDLYSEDIEKLNYRPDQKLD